MQKTDKLITLGFALFSLIVSFLFVFYAVNIKFSPKASTWLGSFAYVIGGYGLFNVYILSWAWRTQAVWAPKANLVIAACLFGVVAMDTFRDGINNFTTEGGIVVGIAVILAINWFAVKKVVARLVP